MTVTADISAPSVTVQSNGGTAVQTTTSQGAGNYGSYPIYLMRRGGTTLPFNGRLYQLIIRGAASSATQIAQANTWVGSKCGIIL